MSLDHDWMRTVLVALFDTQERKAISQALADDAVRDRLRDDLNSVALAGGRLGQIPNGQTGDNLFQGLLALRMKFDRATAIEKLEVNLAMRSARRNSR